MQGLAAYALAVRAVRLAEVLRLVAELPPGHLYARTWAGRTRPRTAADPSMHTLELEWLYRALVMALRQAISDAPRQAAADEKSSPAGACTP